MILRLSLVLRSVAWSFFLFISAVSACRPVVCMIFMASSRLSSFVLRTVEARSLLLSFPVFWLLLLFLLASLSAELSSGFAVRAAL